MNFSTYQQNAVPALGMFAGVSARAVEQTGSVRMRPRGLGDWFTDALSTVHNNVVDGFETITGAKAQREAQNAAVAIAQANAAGQQAQAQTWAGAIPWVAGAIAVVAVAAVLTRK